MSLQGVIGSLSTGTYTVTRKASGLYFMGRYSVGETSTLAVTACVQPMGRKTLVKAEGDHSEDMRLVFSATELLVRTPTQEPDVITIEGEPYEVVKVYKWEAFGGTHWEAHVSKVVVP